MISLTAAKTDDRGIAHILSLHGYSENVLLIEEKWVDETCRLRDVTPVVNLENLAKLSKSKPEIFDELFSNAIDSLCLSVRSSLHANRNSSESDEKTIKELFDKIKKATKDTEKLNEYIEQRKLRLLEKQREHMEQQKPPEEQSTTHTSTPLCVYTPIPHVPISLRDDY
jgi:chromosome segregation ATPase